MNYTFEIKKDLQVPSLKNSKAFVTYPKEHFVLGYRIESFPRQEYMNVHIEILDKVKLSVVDVLNSFTVTEQGFATGIISNQTEIDNWIASATLLNEQLNNSQDEAEIETLTAQIQELGAKPNPIELYVNKYSEVIEYFDNKGKLTSDGLIWASNLSFLKDYL